MILKAKRECNIEQDKSSVRGKARRLFAPLYAPSILTY